MPSSAATTVREMRRVQMAAGIRKAFECHEQRRHERRRRFEQCVVFVAASWPVPRRLDYRLLRRPNPEAM